MSRGCKDGEEERSEEMGSGGEEEVRGRGGEGEGRRLSYGRRMEPHFEVLAPRSMSSFTISMSPLSHALTRGVSPTADAASTST